MNIIGREVEVTVDRPLGSFHPVHRDLYYTLNYGYVKGVMGGDGEEQDAYILGVDSPITKCKGTVIAIVHRLNDTEDKWVVVPKGCVFTKDQIIEQVNFQEKYFDFEIIL